MYLNEYSLLKIIWILVFLFNLNSAHAELNEDKVSYSSLESFMKILNESKQCNNFQDFLGGKIRICSYDINKELSLTITTIISDKPSYKVSINKLSNELDVIISDNSKCITVANKKLSKKIKNSIPLSLQVRNNNSAYISKANGKVYLKKESCELEKK